MTKEEAAEVLLGPPAIWIDEKTETFGHRALRHSPRYLEACKVLGLAPCSTDVLANALYERVIAEMQKSIFEKAMERLKKVERLEQTTVDLITDSLMEDE